MSTKLAELHNERVTTLISEIVKPMLAAGGSYQDILVLTESVVAGVVAFVGNGGGDEQIIDLIAAGAKARVDDLRANVKRSMN